MTLGGFVQKWNGSSWEWKIAQRWNGSAWEDRPLYMYTSGSGWIPTYTSGSGGSGLLAPSGAWTGTAASGYSVTPTDPARTVAKPMARSVVVPNQVFTADMPIVIDAMAKGGISKVRFYCEGNTLDVTTPSWTTYTDPNGTSRRMYGYTTSIDYAACNAINASGTVRIYAEVFPADGTFQNRVIGPFDFHNRSTAYSVTRTVAPSGADHTTIKAAIDYIHTNHASARNARIQITTSGDYQIAGAAVTYNNAIHWLTIEAAGGVTANITSGATRAGIRPFYDGLRFRGSGIVFDLAKFWYLVCESGSGNLMQAWVDGCTITETGGRHAVFDGQPPDQFWLAPSVGGSDLNTYFTDCTAGDVYQGYMNCNLVRNCSATITADDLMQNVEYFHGITAGEINPAGTGGLRTHVAAINITYTGGGSSAKIAASAAPGNARTMTLWKNGSQVGTSLTVTNPSYAPAGSGYTTWADIVSWINTQGGAAGFAATVNGAAGTRRGSSVSKTGLTAVDMAAGSGRELDVFSGSGTLTSWFDIHGDGYQVFATASNRGGRFFSAKNVNSSDGSQGFFVDWYLTSLTDCWFANMEVATNGNGVIAVSQVHSPWYHSGVINSTFYDQPFSMRSDSVGGVIFNPDAYCSFSNNSFFTQYWGGSADADILLDKNNVRSSTLPSGSTNGTTVTANLYVNAPTDLSAGTGMPIGIGARTPIDWNVEENFWLVGPLDINNTTGEGIFTVNRDGRVYWMLSANGTTPTAAEIAAGTGAIEGTGAIKAAGYFDVTLGSVQMDVTFPVGINATGAVFSVVAREEPSGDWSNILRDTSVDVETLPLSRTFVSAQTGASPNFGTCAAGWYLIVVNQRNGTITSITPPSQSAVTTKQAEVVPTVISGNKPCAMFFVELTASRSGAWTIGQTSGSSWVSALYSLSSAPQLISQDGSFVNNSSASYSFSRSVTAGDILIATANLHTNPPEAESGADDVTTDASGVVVANHSYRALSGTVPASGTRTIFAQTSGSFTYTAALVVALRRA